MEGTFRWGSRQFAIYYERSLGFMEFSSESSTDVMALHAALLPVTRVNHSAKCQGTALTTNPYQPLGTEPGQPATTPRGHSLRYGAAWGAGLWIGYFLLVPIRTDILGRGDQEVFLLPAEFILEAVFGRPRTDSVSLLVIGALLYGVVGVMIQLVLRQLPRRRDV